MQGSRKFHPAARYAVMASHALDQYAAIRAARAVTRRRPCLFTSPPVHLLAAERATVCSRASNGARRRRTRCSAYFRRRGRTCRRTRARRGCWLPIFWPMGPGAAVVARCGSRAGRRRGSAPRSSSPRAARVLRLLRHRRFRRSSPSRRCRQHDSRDAPRRGDVGRDGRSRRGAHASRGRRRPLPARARRGVICLREDHCRRLSRSRGRLSALLRVPSDVRVSPRRFLAIAAC